MTRPPNRLRRGGGEESGILAVAKGSSRCWVNQRRVDKRVRLEALPERFQCDPKPTSPMRFHAPLQELMRKGVTKIRWLFDEAKRLGYKGSFGHLARYVAHVRSLAQANGSPAPAERTIRSMPLDPASGSCISPVDRQVAGLIRRAATSPPSGTPSSAPSKIAPRAHRARIPFARSTGHRAPGVGP
jgi:hypothetical protein